MMKGVYSSLKKMAIPALRLKLLKRQQVSGIPAPLSRVPVTQCLCNTASRRTMSDTPDTASNIPEKMQDFLQNFFAFKEHGILSLQSSCQKFCQMYRCLSPEEKYIFLRHLAEHYGVNQESVLEVSQSVVASQERGEAIILKVEERLRNALIPRYQQVFSQIGRIEDGVKFLVDMRADILNSVSTGGTELDVAYLRALQSSLREILSLWFTVGFLNLERITWQSPCDVVQKVNEYEAVHPMRNWADLKRRVGSYRRCFIFTHSSMPREPVVVLHTALSSEISSNIHSIIYSPSHVPGSPVSVSSPNSANSGHPDDEGPEDPSKIQAAMFYSITSTQKGLQGVDLGNYLIKKVVQEIRTEFPHMTKFSSISPIPGFRDWLVTEINREIHLRGICEYPDEQRSLLNDEEVLSIQVLSENENQPPLETLKSLVQSHLWANNSTSKDIMKPILMRLCARYLYLEKRRRLALNPVANFHLQNGAVLWRLNWMADLSLRGLSKSCGIMVNYRYFLEDTETNSRQYIEQFDIKATDQVKELVST